MASFKSPRHGRRDLLKTAWAGALVAGAGAVPASAAGRKSVAWSSEADVIVVGSGAAALAAAVEAVRLGSSVVIVEKGVVAGGTTSKSDGGYWIPNNRLMREKGQADRREDAIGFMLRHAYPADFDAKAERFGIGEREYALIAAFYDNAAPVVDAFEQAGVLSYMGFGLIDYYDEPNNKAPYGRTLLPRQPDGSLGSGRELVRQLRAPLTAKNVPLLVKHRVTGLVRNAKGGVTGIVAETPNGVVNIRAKKAVIFGTGGYGHNEALIRNFQPGPIYGGCAVPTNEGDFIHIATREGVAIGNMNSAWRAQVVLDDVLKTRSVARDIFHIPGDSMLLVNRNGRRALNEKRTYNDRTRAHYNWDAASADYPNRLMFMIYDQRTKEMFAGNPPIPAAGVAAPHEVSGATAEALAAAIQAKLDGFADRIGEYKLNANFATALSAEMQAFARIARDGPDPDFARGNSVYDREWHTGYAEKDSAQGKWPKNSGPNSTAYALSETGPYYAVVLAPGILDTNGGPITDARGQVIDVDGRPVPGLYGAGNCVASPAGQAYWGAGTTLGLAITFGALAGRAAAAEPIKDE